MSNQSLITIFNLIKEAESANATQLFAVIFMMAFVISGLISYLRITLHGYLFKINVVVCLLGAIVSSYILATTESSTLTYSKAYIILINSKENISEEAFLNIKETNMH